MKELITLMNSRKEDQASTNPGEYVRPDDAEFVGGRWFRGTVKT